MHDEQSLITGQIITELPASAGVVIIGGIVGAATAFWFAKAGRSPIVMGSPSGGAEC